MPTRSLLTLLFACLATWAAVAAPPPKPKPWVTGWKEEDPDKDCKFVRKGGVLTIEVPAKEHDLGARHFYDPETGFPLEKGVRPPLLNAPRLLRDLQGDFVAQVRVSGDFVPSAAPSAPGRIPFIAAGLVLMAGEKTCIRLERGGERLKDGIPEYANWEIIRGLKRGQAQTRHRVTSKETYLRLERKGNTFTAAYSEDGKDWKKLRSHELQLPAKMRLGVTACSTSSAPFKPRFDQFRLTAKQKKGGG